MPVSQLHLISRYTGRERRRAPCTSWAAASGTRPSKAAEQVRDSPPSCSTSTPAAPRAKATFRFSPQDYETFANDFGFEETADQNAAIHAVIQDMIARAPWTAWSAATWALARPRWPARRLRGRDRRQSRWPFWRPTTLLAEQHYQTLVDRFAKWPVKVAEMSRFRSGKEITPRSRACRRHRGHRGRHAQAAVEVRSSRTWACSIIDEEHRFGVRHKEADEGPARRGGRAHAHRHAHPRTMGMALEGLRDLSVIATAPQRRLAIKTFVRNERQRRHPRGRAARTQARRQVYFCTTRWRPSRTAAPSWKNSCPRPASPWPTARCPSASWSA